MHADGTLEILASDHARTRLRKEVESIRPLRTHRLETELVFPSISSCPNEDVELPGHRDFTLIRLSLRLDPGTLSWAQRLMSPYRSLPVVDVPRRRRQSLSPTPI